MRECLPLAITTAIHRQWSTSPGRFPLQRQKWRLELYHYPDGDLWDRDCTTRYPANHDVVKRTILRARGTVNYKHSNIMRECLPLAITTAIHRQWSTSPGRFPLQRHKWRLELYHYPDGDLRIAGRRVDCCHTIHASYTSLSSILPALRERREV
jgi:hypothetical protein